MTPAPQPLEVLHGLLAPRLSPGAQAFLQDAAEPLGAAMEAPALAMQLATCLALASRHVRSSVPLSPQPQELAAAQRAVAGWNPVHWGLLDALRAALLLMAAQPGGRRATAVGEARGAAFEGAYSQAFAHADHGECRALYRALPLLPRGERFVWRAAEGCRSNMRPLFEAVACDSPYAARHFDAIAWHQLVMKALFLDVPLARLHGFDARLTPALARSALDWVEERRSAGRAVPPQAWLCLGPFVDARALQALQHELQAGTPPGQRAALLALVRGHALERLARAGQGAGDALAPHRAWLATLPRNGVTTETFQHLVDTHACGAMA